MPRSSGLAAILLQEYPPVAVLLLRDRATSEPFVEDVQCFASSRGGVAPLIACHRSRHQIDEQPEERPGNRTS